MNYLRAINCSDCVIQPWNSLRPRASAPVFLWFRSLLGTIFHLTSEFTIYWSPNKYLNSNWKNKNETIQKTVRADIIRPHEALGTSDFFDTSLGLFGSGGWYPPLPDSFITDAINSRVYWYSNNWASNYFLFACFTQIVWVWVLYLKAKKDDDYLISWLRRKIHCYNWI